MIFLMESYKIERINNGTVIDHIKPGNAVNVLNIIQEPSNENTVSLAINVYGRTRKKYKDIVKVENKYLDKKETDMISLISGATINKIKNGEVFEKNRVETPKQFKGLVMCSSPRCVTNPQIDEDGVIHKEPVDYFFKVLNEDPFEIECYYCGGKMKGKDITDRLILKDTKSKYIAWLKESL